VDKFDERIRRHMIVGWIRFWDRREPGEALALIRILVALVLLYDLTCVLRLGLVAALWAPVEEHGIGPATHAVPIALAYRWLGASARAAHWLVLSACIGSSHVPAHVYSWLRMRSSRN
jgi:type IV secretory pathway TraG/TraD family ATPase VirD4